MELSLASLGSKIGGLVTNALNRFDDAPNDERSCHFIFEWTKYFPKPCRSEMLGRRTRVAAA